MREEKNNMRFKDRFTALVLVELLLVLMHSCHSNPDSWNLRSPDKKITISINKQGNPDTMDDMLFYSVSLKEKGNRLQVIEPSPLGLEREDGRFVENLRYLSSDLKKNVRENYRLVSGKHLDCSSEYSELVIHFQNRGGEKINLVFRAFDDGVAFKYRFPGQKSHETRVLRELSGFNLGTGQAWAHAYDTIARWSPGYETYYEGPMEIGTSAPLNKNGWAFPVLFKTLDTWIMISESDLDGTYGASHLYSGCNDGLYRIKFAEAEEAMGYYENTSHSKIPWETPWRFMIIGNDLSEIVESDMVTDLADPSRLENTSWIKPGRASWSWWSESDSPRDYKRLLPFIDFAAEMGWEYSLVDANWNHMKNGSVEKLAEYANEKGVGLLLWYNSGGKHNEVPEEPRNLMDEREIRRNEFERISKMGIKGIKVDFFQSDKEEIIKQYIEILEDAADYQLVVNFHGCTLPRGWRRTWPNLLTMEAVRGSESYKYDRNYPQDAPSHLATVPFTRNVVGPCDYTPGGFSNSTYPHLTTYAFELALAIVIESGIMHYADTPGKTRDLPDYAQSLLKELPVCWDETRYLAGYPGKDAVIARRKGERWYIGGINGESVEKDLTINLETLMPAGTEMEIIHDGEPAQLQNSRLTAGESTFKVHLKPYGGFVATIDLKD
ncbi:MAG: glycoside hydrolase family 97 catalytic domain-containing protein [Bacteroidales bacterium]